MQCFIQYLQAKGLAITTIKHYTRLTKLYIQWSTHIAHQHTKKDVLNYLTYLKQHKKLQAITRYNVLIALQHYFTHLQQQNKISSNPTTFIKLRGIKKRKLHYIYNLEEIDTLTDTYYYLQVKQAEEKHHIHKGQYFLERSYLAKMRNYTMLLLIAYQGLRTREVLQLQINDIDLHKATILVRQGTTRGNQRTLPLKATQIGTLIQYTNQIRPKLEHPQTNNSFFLPLPKKDPKAKKQAQACLKGVTKKLKELAPNFISLNQLRASVITHWIQTKGLRKAQYLAGHKSIHSTEEYIPNVLEDLTEDIIQYNPF
ncbi:tyrosine-type recombinase/integrase [Tenacibaculum maritimum]|uniref:tyrosine-type recombinase/integrase n=4 Tax=Tenacibaculum maritimum TaxID=107401 RepID=UPI0012E43D30|nr:site-specific integrase [Tenacibaculum maritimum]MDB0601963.1 site-specific integrase [Tenacibaculum maritimum]MDB0613893.1 site-specific integrase [Tenacibaculum maritimum]CAA0217300.1 Site-specific recombinase XerD [Tenacibaculum maritimum]CAA0230029.1 Phage integrase family protein [Tenacibaculum maritimum]